MVLSKTGRPRTAQKLPKSLLWSWNGLLPKKSLQNYGPAPQLSMTAWFLSYSFFLSTNLAFSASRYLFSAALL